MITMYDSIYVANLPAGAEAYAGYVGGFWPTFSSLPPAEYKLSIAINAREDAMCLDVESGDAVAAQAPGWWRAAQQNHYLYTSASNAQLLINTMADAGIARSQYKLWTAHYTGTPHVCAPDVCGYPVADGTQWTDAGPNNCDVSLLNADFFATSPPPAPPKPTVPPMEDDVQIPPQAAGAPTAPVGVSFNGSPYTTVGFCADPGVLGGGTVTVRCAFHITGNTWQVETATMNETVQKAVVPVPANCDGVSFTREDTLNVTLVPNFA